jgi:hypothetical protein
MGWEGRRANQPFPKRRDLNITVPVQEKPASGRGRRQLALCGGEGLGGKVAFMYLVADGKKGVMPLLLSQEHLLTLFRNHHRSP